MSRIFEPSIEWRDGDVPWSPAFNDVYYNRENGLEESRFVFLGGNNLPAAWEEREQFTIAETGFGTGLNFLATWQMFNETARPGQRLDFISIEQYPLHPDDLRRALHPWRGRIDPVMINRLLEIYPPRFPGFHRRWVSDKITLTLIYDDGLRAFRQMQNQVDALYLDGFSPSRNPDFWQGALFKEMARLSHSATSFASFTAARHVRDLLEDARFSTERHAGFGKKRYRITGRFLGQQRRIVTDVPKHVTIIGTGLAGAACAHALKRRGVACTVIEQNDKIASEASGNRLGLINPKVEIQDNGRTDAGLAAFSFCNATLQDIQKTDDIAYRQNGALHLVSENERKDRLEKIFSQADWLAPERQWADAQNIPSLTGVTLDSEGIVYPAAATVNAAALVQAYLNDHNIRFNEKRDAASLPLGPIILACGWGIRQFAALDAIPLQPVRGQVTYIRINDLLLKTTLVGGTYIAGLLPGVYGIGATFQQEDTDKTARDQDDADNVTAFKKLLNQPGAAPEIIDRWAQIRTATRDRFPLVGKLPGRRDLYVTGALGSHGIQFSLLHAEILACQLTGSPLPLGADALHCLSIDRFYRDLTQ